MAGAMTVREVGYDGDPDGNLQHRWENTTNTPLVSVSWLGNGQAIADVYLLTFTNNAGAVSVDVVCDSKNPWNRTGLPVTADGATGNADIVPGLSIVVSASVDTAWAATVVVGNFMDNTAAVTERFEFEVVDAGSNSTGFRFLIENTGDAIMRDVYLYALPGYYHDDDDTFLRAIENHTDPTRHKLAPKATFVLTFQNWGDDVGSGKKKADLYVARDGGAAALCVTGALFDGATVYEYGVSGYEDGTDPLPGLAVTLADTTADPTSASITLEVRDGYSWLEYADDQSGSPGTYANQDLLIGDIGVGSFAFAWARWAPPSSAQPDELRMFNVVPRGKTT